jgi:hypothetical protein
MRCSFLVSSPAPATAVAPGTAHHAAYPRSVRKTLRLGTHSQATRTNGNANGVDSYMAQCEFRTDSYHNQNLVDSDPLADEFGDIDNEHDGLTITDAMDDADLWRFCTGYDVL